MNVTKKQVLTALQLGLMQFMSWCICTISWRSVAQANYMVSVMADSTLATLSFFVIRKMVKEQDEASVVQYL